MVSIAFVSGLPSFTLKKVKEVSDHVLENWSVSRATETGEIESSRVTLQSIEKIGGNYTATIRIGLEILGAGVAMRSDNTYFGAYGQLTVGPEDELYECLALFYEAALEYPRDERKRIVLEKGNGARLASLSITKGIFRVVIDDEPVTSSTQVVDSSYFRVSEYEVMGEVSFSVTGGGMKKGSTLLGLELGLGETPRAAVLEKTPNPDARSKFTFGKPVSN